jgi:hypothetical protein
MSHLPARRLLLTLFLGLVLETPRSSADPPTLERAGADPRLRQDACLGADANVTASWSGTQVQFRHTGASIDYTGTACGRYVLDLDVVGLQPISGYGTSFKFEVPEFSEQLGTLPQLQCESLVVDVSYYRRPPRVRALTRFASGRKHGVWHPEQPNFPCMLESSLGFTDGATQTAEPSGTTRYRIAASIRVGPTVRPVTVRAWRQP